MCNYKDITAVFIKVCKIREHEGLGFLQNWSLILSHTIPSYYLPPSIATYYISTDQTISPITLLSLAHQQLHINITTSQRQ